MLINRSKFFKYKKIARARVVFKIMTSVHWRQIARENMLLLVNNVHEKTSQKVNIDEISKALFVICTRVTTLKSRMWLVSALFLASQKRVIPSGSLLTINFFVHCWSLRLFFFFFYKKLLWGIVITISCGKERCDSSCRPLKTISSLLTPQIFYYVKKRCHP